MTEKPTKNKSDKFLGYILIALGVLGAISKVRSHQKDWNPGQIVKLCLIIASFGYGLWIVLKKSSK